MRRPITGHRLPHLLAGVTPRFSPMLFPVFFTIVYPQIAGDSMADLNLVSGIVNQMLHPADPADLSMEYKQNGRAWLRMPNYLTCFPIVKNIVTNM
jgi:hypothetical protein